MKISCASHVFILDFNALSTESKPSRHSASHRRYPNKRAAASRSTVQLARLFLSRLLSDESILKLGWSFQMEDYKMLRRAGNGMNIKHTVIHAYW